MKTNDKVNYKLDPLNENHKLKITELVNEQYVFCVCFCGWCGDILIEHLERTKK